MFVFNLTSYAFCVDGLKKQTDKVLVKAMRAAFSDQFFRYCVISVRLQDGKVM